MFLEDFRHEVRLAESGEDAIAILEKERFDLAIVDMRLPGMDGNETIVAAHRLEPNMRFIVYTGSSDYLLPKALTEIGLDESAVFYKPIAGDVIAQATRNILTPQKERPK